MMIRMKFKKINDLTTRTQADLVWISFYVAAWKLDVSQKRV